MDTQSLQTQILSKIKEASKEAFRKEIKTELKLEFPPEVALGDFTLACFELAKDLKISPAEAAKKLAKSFSKPHPNPLLAKERRIVSKAKAVGPYLNIKINNQVLFESTLDEINKKQEKYGSLDLGKKQKVMVEYLSPNTNKPLHLGHARNGALGMAVSNILEVAGYKVIKANLVNDRGVHICKSMLAWQKWGKGETPESAKMKGDHLVGKYYVRYAKEAEKNPELKKEIQEMLKKWEAGDKEIIKLWKMMNGWVLAGFRETYQKLGLEFDEFFYESKTYKLGKDIIAEGLRRRIFYRDEKGAVLFDLSEKEFGLTKDGRKKKITLLRSDGTSLYYTQDLGTTLLKFKKYALDKAIWVVGNEQTFYLQSLFKILGSLGYKWAKNLYHLSYGMVNLPEGKMKSREGKVVDADDLITRVEGLVTSEIKKRDINSGVSKKETAGRAEKIAVGAIKFQMLRVKPMQDITFNPQESIALDGFTGPYCQYAYARISGIARKAKSLAVLKNLDYSLLGNEEELFLLQKLIQFPDQVKKAVEDLDPSQIATHIFSTAKAFNQFYQKHPVLEEKNKKLTLARLALIQAVALVLKKGLNLLGIEVLERM